MQFYLTVSDITDLTNHLFLWHLTPRRNADRISTQGFIPKGEKRDGDPARPVWFSHSAFSFVRRVQQEKKKAEYDGFLVALPVDDLYDWTGHVPDEVLVFQALPPETILCRFPAEGAQTREGLAASLSALLGTDSMDRFIRLCRRDDVPWQNRTSPAAQIMYLDRARYDQEQLTALALGDGLVETSPAECEALTDRIAAIDLRFYHHFLRDYYFTYGERHVGRALAVAAARRLGRESVVTLFLDPSADPGHNHIARLIADTRDRLSPSDLALAMIELRVARFDPNSELDHRLETWILDQPESVNHARYFIERGGMPFHARYGPAAVELGSQILIASHEDPNNLLMEMTESTWPNVRLGATTGLGIAGNSHAIPYLETCLDSPWKRLREEAVRALGRIGTEASVRILKQVAAEDKTARIRKAAQRTLKELDPSP